MYVDVVGKVLLLVVRLVDGGSEGNDHHSDLISLVAPRQPAQFIRVVGDEQSVLYDLHLHF